MTTARAVTVNRNDLAHRYEARLNDRVVAAAYYLPRPGRVVFTHTETEPEYEGQGIASTLAKRALDDVRTRGEKVVAQCPFVSDYIRRHAEYADLLAADD